jgi:hypothetical protein
VPGKLKKAKVEGNPIIQMKK